MHRTVEDGHRIVETATCIFHEQHITSKINATAAAADYITLY